MNNKKEDNLLLELGGLSKGQEYWGLRTFRQLILFDDNHHDLLPTCQLPLKNKINLNDRQ